MAVSVVQSIAHVGNPPATFGSNITAGNTVFIIASGYTTTSGNPSTGTVKLGGGTVSGTLAFFNNGTTGGILSPLSAGNGAYICIWMLPNVQLAAQTAVDITFTGASGVIGQAIYEVSGLGSNPVLDVSNSGSAGTGTTVSSGSSGAITSATEIVFGGTMAFAGTPATNSGWVCLQPAGGSDLTAGYQIPVSSGGSYTWSQTSSGSPWAAFVAAVKPTPAAAPVYPLTQARAKLPVPVRKGRVISHPGGVVNNPGVVAVSGALAMPVRASLPLNLPGRMLSRVARIPAGTTVAGSASIAAAGALNVNGIQGAGASLTGASQLTVHAVQSAVATLVGAGTVTSNVIQDAVASLIGAGVLSNGITSGSASMAGVSQLLVAAIQAAGVTVAAASVVSLNATQDAVVVVTARGTLAFVTTSANPSRGFFALFP